MVFMKKREYSKLRDPGHTKLSLQMRCFRGRDPKNHQKIQKSSKNLKIIKNLKIMKNPNIVNRSENLEKS